MISERTLKKWRKEALEKVYPTNSSAGAFEVARQQLHVNQRILKMTQELIDQHLIRR